MRVPWRVLLVAVDAVVQVGRAIGRWRRRRRPAPPPELTISDDAQPVTAPRAPPPPPPPVPEVPAVPLPTLDAEQKAAVHAIVTTLAAHPLAPGLDRWRAHLLPVLQVNSWHESRFRPKAANTAGEDSHGLFQLNRDGGVGTGHSIESIQDPRTNTRLILDELVTRWQTDPERERMHSARNVGDLAAAFAALVERPGSDRHPDGHIVQGRWAVGEARKATLQEWSLSVASIALPSLDGPGVGDLFNSGSERLT